MLLVELFGRTPKEPTLTPDQQEELRRQRVNTLRTSDKPAAGKKFLNVADESGVKAPEALNWDDFLKWHQGEQERQGKFDSEGPQVGDIIMTHKGHFTVGNPNGGGNMIATVRAKDGREGKIAWMKLSRPVRKNDRQYYAYEG